jgi:hypothetical protein
LFFPLADWHIRSIGERASLAFLHERHETRDPARNVFIARYRGPRVSHLGLLLRNAMRCGNDGERRGHRDRGDGTLDHRHCE